MKVEKISLVFPTPILHCSLGRRFTKDELDFCRLNEPKTWKNYGNFASKDTYIFTHPEMAGLKEVCQSAINTYVTDILKPKNDITAYITQSWFTYTKRDEFMHEHNHLNSYLSGVLYINADKDSDKIMFHRKKECPLGFTASEYDVMNADSWWFPIHTGDIVVFPSTTYHSIPKVDSSRTRISLAFNAFLKGTLGEPDVYTELKL